MTITIECGATEYGKKVMGKEYVGEFRPDYAVPPGWLLEERLELREWSQAEFARRCGRSAKLISDIISGKAPIEPETALQFEKVLDLSADIWLNLEAEYQLHLAREREREHAAVFLGVEPEAAGSDSQFAWCAGKIA